MNEERISKRFQNLEKIEKILSDREFLESKHSIEASNAWIVYLTIMLSEAKEKDCQDESQQS